MRPCDRRSFPINRIRKRSLAYILSDNLIGDDSHLTCGAVLASRGQQDDVIGTHRARCMASAGRRDLVDPDCAIGGSGPHADNAAATCWGTGEEYRYDPEARGDFRRAERRSTRYDWANSEIDRKGLDPRKEVCNPAQGIGLMRGRLPPVGWVCSRPECPSQLCFRARPTSLPRWLPECDWKHQACVRCSLRGL